MGEGERAGVLLGEDRNGVLEPADMELHVGDRELRGLHADVERASTLTAPGFRQSDETVEAVHRAVREELSDPRQKRSIVDTELRKHSVRGHRVQRGRDGRGLVQIHAHVVEARGQTRCTRRAWSIARCRNAMPSDGIVRAIGNSLRTSTSRSVTDGSSATWFASLVAVHDSSNEGHRRRDDRARQGLTAGLVGRGAGGAAACSKTSSGGDAAALAGRVGQYHRPSRGR